MAETRNSTLRQTTIQTSNNLNTTSSTPATRRTTITQTTQEIIDQKNEVKDAASGKEYLEKKALAISGKPYTTNALTEILLHITQIKSVPLPAQTAIRAVAFILEEQAELKIADTVAKLAITALGPHIATIHANTESLAKTAQELDSIRVKLSEPPATQDRSSNTNDEAIIERLETMQRTIDQISTTVKEPAKAVSYKEALMNGMSNPSGFDSQTVQRLAREAAKERQIIINIGNDSPLAPGKVSHAQLVEKIKSALTNLPSTDSALEVKTVTQYRNGGTMIEFASAEAANTLKKGDNQEKFLKALDPKASIRERAYAVVIQFVPINFNPSSTSDIKALESENGWNPGTVLTARWIKPPARRTNHQQFAHIIATLNDPMVANEGIRSGITFRNNKLQMKKNRREPMRCAKCQHYSHIAKDCLSHTDRCANCAEEHKTSECQTPYIQRCIPCEANDHASWNRDCPEFEKRCQALDDKYPENLMPYFPSDEAWTHAQAPPKAKPFVNITGSQRDNAATNPSQTKQTKLTDYSRTHSGYRDRPSRGRNRAYQQSHHSHSPPPPPTSPHAAATDSYFSQYAQRN